LKAPIDSLGQRAGFNDETFKKNFAVGELESTSYRDKHGRNGPKPARHEIWVFRGAAKPENLQRLACAGCNLKRTKCPTRDVPTRARATPFDAGQAFRGWGAGENTQVLMQNPPSQFETTNQ